MIMLNGMNFTGDNRMQSVQISLYKANGHFCKAAKYTASIIIIFATATVLCNILSLIFCHADGMLLLRLCLALMDPKHLVVFISHVKEYAK